MQNSQLEVNDEYDKEFILLAMGILNINNYLSQKSKKDTKL